MNFNIIFVVQSYFTNFRYVYRKMGNKFRAYLLGVVSRGSHCAARNKPGIYTNVVSFLPWIINVIKDGTC